MLNGGENSEVPFLLKRVGKEKTFQCTEHKSIANYKRETFHFSLFHVGNFVWYLKSRVQMSREHLLRLSLKF
jgi:hypothetical protein